MYFLVILFFCGSAFGQESFRLEWARTQTIPRQTNKPTDVGRCPFICQGACQIGFDFAMGDDKMCHTYPCKCVNKYVPKLLQDRRIGKVLEDDMIISPSQVDLVKGLYGQRPLPRSIFSIKRFYWKEYKSGGYYNVPYVLDGSLSHKIRSNLRLVFAEFRRQTCIRFIRRTNKHTNYLRITSDDGCYSTVGMVGGEQIVSLENTECYEPGIAMHELMHSLGFFHEQSRPDRDQYIRIVKENIQKGLSGNFDKMTSAISKGSPYDYGSIMHYKLDAFSKNGWNTIEPLKKTTAFIGQRTMFSNIDIDQINLLYPCKRFSYKPAATTPAPQTTTPPPAESAACVDKFISCPTWVTKGYCDKSSAYFKYAEKYCNKTCGICKQAPPAPKLPMQQQQECKDKIPTTSCLSWLNYGYCEHSGFGPIVRSKCPKTCKVCEDVKDTSVAVKKSVVSDVIEDDRCGVTSFRENNLRIVGGEVVNHGTIPWQVNLQFDKKHVCGATLLNKQWIVTAAHCIEGPNAQYTAILGGQYKQRVGAKAITVKFSNIYIHPSYDKETLQYDIALLQIERPIQYTKYIRPVCLSSKSPTDLDEMTVSGWGETQNNIESEDVLRKTKIPVINRNECNRAPWRTAGQIYNGMVCAGYNDGHKDACKGDSGGPAVMVRNGYYELVAVISWGYGCAGSYSPGVYTDIYAVRSWITSFVGRS